MLVGKTCYVRYLLTFLLMCPVIAACTKDNPTGPSVLRHNLETAPKQVFVGGQEYKLETFLWRDFQPISPPDGKPLIALIKIVEQNTVSIPTTVDADSLWVINGTEIWATTFSNETRPATPPHILEKIARDGPKWGPGIDVDVVIRILDGVGNGFLLRAEGQPIGRTD